MEKTTEWTKPTVEEHGDAKDLILGGAFGGVPKEPGLPSDGGFDNSASVSGWVFLTFSIQMCTLIAIIGY